MSDKYFTVRFKIPDEHRPLTYVSSSEMDAYSYYDMLRERSHIEYAELYSPDGERLENWRTTV